MLGQSWWDRLAKLASADYIKLLRETYPEVWEVSEFIPGLVEELEADEIRSTV
jgi:hypothetical protein